MRYFGLLPFVLGVGIQTASAQTEEPQSGEAAVPKGKVDRYNVTFDQSKNSPGTTRKIDHHPFNQSKIYPGTTRDYWVYVPQQYDPAKPACLFVCQDTIQWNAPEVMDQLIEEKAMPVTVGIWIGPGQLKASLPRPVGRSNRSREYTWMSDEYARFLLEEFLPYVAKEHNLNISNDPNDRCIAGTSNGGIAAFTAAWERPESFHRVITMIASYVGMAGGNGYPVLIRKTEPKPLRVFLQTGWHDLNMCYGDWWWANQDMERSLTFAGYEVNHAWGDTGHQPLGGEHAMKIFPDAMRWIWKDWPQPVKTGLGNVHLQTILVPGETWHLVADGFQAVQGAAANLKGEVFFNDTPNNKTYKIGLDGKVSVVLGNSMHAAGQAFGSDGRLYAALPDAEQIVAYDAAGQRTVIAEGVRGQDLLVRSDGSIYVTSSGPAGSEASKVWFISPKGEKKVVDTGLKSSTGVTLAPDQAWLQVADGGSHAVYNYRIESDGSLTLKQKCFHLTVPATADDSGAGGMCVDRMGYLYIATRMGIQIGGDGGRVNSIIPTPNRKVTSLCFGGENFDTLFAMCGDKIFMRKMKNKGVHSFQEFFTPAPLRL